MIFIIKKLCPYCMEEVEEIKDKKFAYFCRYCDAKFRLEEIEYVEEKDIDWKHINDIPKGCMSCGGPYPDCVTSCKIFDN